jgi:hypothetical protein
MPRRARLDWCRLCGEPWTPDLDKGIRESKWNANQVNEWLKRHGESASRELVYKHRDHVMGPQTAIIKAGANARKELTIREASNDVFLEAIRDIGYSKAIENPQSVTLDHAIKAVGILEGRKGKSGDILNLLIAVVSGHRPEIEVNGTVIEGEVRELGPE